MFKIKDGLQLFNRQTTVRYPSGNYGSFEIDGGGKGNWEGYSIGGRVAFMHANGTEWGIYNDVNNQWTVRGWFQGATELFHAGNLKLATNSGGVTVTGTLTASSLVGSINYNQISNPPSIPDGNLYVRKSGDTMTGALTMSGGTPVNLGDGNHYLKKISAGYSGVTIDGPQLQGHQGGELTTNYQGDKWALRWNTSQDVHIGRNLHISGNNAYLGNGTGQSYLRIGDQVTDDNAGGWNKGVHLNAQYHGRFRIRTSNYNYGALETYYWADSSVSPSMGIYGNTSVFRFTGSITNIRNKDNATFWHSGNDGSGSGLDADLLDGVQASQFLRKDVNSTLNGGLVIEGSIDSGGTDYGYYQSAGTNLILKGDASGRSGIFFQSEKNGTNINHTSDYGFIQFHSYGYGGSSGEAIDMVIGTANDSTDHLILTTPYTTGLKFGYRNATSGTGLTTTNIWHGANDGSGSGLDADLLDGRNSTDFASAAYIDENYYDFTVNGDANTYYPVGISEGGHYGFHTYSISRGYSWTAPSTWNTSTHKGGLTLSFQNCGDGAWGGNDKTIRVLQFHETYTTMVGGIGLSTGGAASAGVIVWLRGGGAKYRFHSPRGSKASVSVYLSSVTASNGSVFAPRSYSSSTVQSEVYARYPVRGSGSLYSGNNVVWHAGNDGSGSGLDADLLDGQHASAFASASHSHSYLPLSGGTVTGGTSLRAGGTHLGNHEFASASGTSTGYADAGIEIREGAYGGNSNYSAPRLAFHWGGVVASNISIDAAGAILIRNNPGTSYENLRANNFYANGTNIVWNAGNDGSGSGLDADLLDGYHAGENGGNKVLKLASNGYSQIQNWTNVANSGIYSTTANSAHFYPNTASSYGTWRIDGSRGGYTGILFSYSGGGNNNGVHLMFDGSRNGGLWNTAWSGDWAYYYHASNRCLGVGGSTTSSSYGLYEQGGGIYSTGNITAYSDVRVKENIQTIDNALETVTSMRGVTYNRIDDPEKKTVIGFIAQEVEAIEKAKPLVTYAEDIDQYGVSYGNVTALLVEAIKELKEEIGKLKQEIEELKNE